jgi:hypothetical protein
MTLKSVLDYLDYTTIVSTPFRAQRPRPSGPFRPLPAPFRPWLKGSSKGGSSEHTEAVPFERDVSFARGARQKIAPRCAAQFDLLI